MLDRKVKDVDAGIELLEDRAKNNKMVFFIVFITGWSIVLSGLCLVPFKWDEAVIGFGIALLIIATWFFISWWSFDILIKIEKKMENKKL